MDQEARNEFDRVNQRFIELEQKVQNFHDLEVFHVAPAKPREGMLRLADGTNWNPGAGAGLYLYISGAWTKL